MTDASDSTSPHQTVDDFSDRIMKDSTVPDNRGGEFEADDVAKGGEVLGPAVINSASQLAESMVNVSDAGSEDKSKMAVKDYASEILAIQERYKSQTETFGRKLDNLVNQGQKRKSLFPELHQIPSKKNKKSRGETSNFRFSPQATSGPRSAKQVATVGHADMFNAKSACLTLNEIKPGLEYVVISQSGPVHEPTFTMGVTLNGEQFTGTGRTKKQAKQSAAEKALKSIVQFKNPHEAQIAMGQISASGAGVADVDMDFTKDSIDELIDEINDGTDIEISNGNSNGNQDTSSPMSVVEEITRDNSEDSPGAFKNGSSEPVQAKTFVQPQGPTIDENRNPVMTLNELIPGLEFECSETGNSPATKRFTMKVWVGDQLFEGSGSSKKQAKQACSRSVLNKLYNANFTTPLVSPMDAQSGGKTGPTTDTGDRLVKGTDIPLAQFSINQELADNIGKAVLEKFDRLMTNNPVASRRKVIAGIVMTLKDQSPENIASKDLTVITVTTGTKCVSGEYMSVSGSSLNDCHAEIISRRGLCRFLYSQLENIAKNGGQIPKDSILEKSSTGGYRVKPDVQFHLYINTAPCGDARIFSPHETSAGMEEEDKHANRKSRGQLRTKIESGEGTIPVKASETIQTWDAVMQGARLLTMSCSDKICRWNVLGVQGSLLSYYLEPVYLHSIILGSMFHPVHMLRAVTKRIQNSLCGLPLPFRLHTPKMNLLSSPESRQPGKAPNHSVNWTLGDTVPEILDATKGKEQEHQGASRLCKATLFKRWLGLSQHSGLSTRCSLSSPVPTTYITVKEGSTDFQTAKEQLFKAFQLAKLGEWVKKPMEQDEFEA